eukprot:TRINITY_DN5531_c0_g1_i3.p1 TRINITY_DN5531_c0_g1~~TRINITY_DN5531_c0_g1_i3.p1  ORF type:complete len:178 (+),score=25.62 TRINITY_DN5531_c0_g1_i3:243-776(+)
MLTTCVVWLSDTVLVSSDESGLMYVWDLMRSASAPLPLQGHTSLVWDIGINATRTKMVSVGPGSEALIWDTSSSIPVLQGRVAPAHIPSCLYAVVFHPKDDETIVVGGYRAPVAVSGVFFLLLSFPVIDGLKVIKLSSGLLRTIGEADIHSVLALSEDGNLLLAASAAWDKGASVRH